MDSKPQPFVSIVTPVYNTEKYIAECIESVLSQTYTNWEYIIVDNQSVDKTNEIAQYYAEKDKRIRIYNNENFLNMMQNWNHAISQISPKSKYFKVVHADDWLFPECIEKMVEVAEENPSVGIVGSYRLDENKVNLDGLPYPSHALPGHQVCRLILLHGLHLFGSPTSLLIRSDLALNREKFYNESNIQADTEVCFDILQNNDFGFVHQVLTFTRRHNETVSYFATELGTWRPAKLLILKKYGRIYLTEEEFDEVYKTAFNQYYRFLGLHLFRLRKKEFRQRRNEFYTYHKKALEDLGYPVYWGKLFKASLVVLYNHILSQLRIG
ncbi:MAG: glycosyltransferase family 2 protein [Deltaproteobacteria bacterium]|nr:MAG: glycosyltransferase family 2 protein [Deltaproteobacteria bacterium]